MRNLIKLLRGNSRLEVFVKPNKRRACIKEFDEQGRLVVELSEPAIEDKANLQLIKLFKSEGIRVSIIRGFSSRRKLLELKWDS